MKLYKVILQLPYLIHGNLNMELIDHIGELVSFRITPDFIMLCIIAFQGHKRLNLLEDRVNHIRGHLGLDDAA